LGWREYPTAITLHLSTSNAPTPFKQFRESICYFLALGATYMNLTHHGKESTIVVREHFASAMMNLMKLIQNTNSQKHLRWPPFTIPASVSDADSSIIKPVVYSIVKPTITQR
jgi:hypothetical protein